MYELHGVLHYAVGNMPCAVPHTSTYALTNATLPYQIELARFGPAGATSRDAALALGLNTHAGHVTNAPVAEFLGAQFVEPHAVDDDAAVQYVGDDGTPAFFAQEIVRTIVARTRAGNDDLVAAGAKADHDFRIVTTGRKNERVTCAGCAIGDDALKSQPGCRCAGEGDGRVMRDAAGGIDRKHECAPVGDQRRRDLQWPICDY